MTLMLRMITLCLLLTLVGCGQDPGEIALTSNSPDAVILMRVLPNADEHYSLAIQRFDPNALQFDRGFMSGTFINAWKNPAPQFVAKTVEPSVYAFQSFDRQLNWALCFHRDTLYFRIRPGQILYLGTFDPNFHLAELQLNVQSHGDEVLTRGSGVRHYLENISPPRILPPTTSGADFAEAQKFIATSMPQVRAGLQPAAYTRTRFGVGYNLMGQRYCGSFLADDIRPQKPQAQ